FGGICGTNRRAWPGDGQRDRTVGKHGPLGRDAAGRGEASRKCPRKTGGALSSAPRKQHDWIKDRTAYDTGAGGTRSGMPSDGGPGWIPLARLQPSDLLAAGHLQGPARTRTTYTDHLLSLVSRD